MDLEFRVGDREGLVEIEGDKITFLIYDKQFLDYTISHKIIVPITQAYINACVKLVTRRYFERLK